jgi:hypothetical protein
MSHRSTIGIGSLGSRTQTSSRPAMNFAAGSFRSSFRQAEFRHQAG